MIKITKAGWIYITITILLGVAAVNTGNNLVYLIDAALLSFMGISGFFGKKNLSGIEPQIEVPFEIYATVPFSIKVKIKNNKKILPSFLLKVSIEEKSLIFPYVENNETQEKYLQLKLPERGYFQIKEISICSPFPFNFFIRCKNFPIDIKAIVYPKPEKCSTKFVGEKGKKKEKEEGNKISTTGEIHSIKEYTKGIPLKYIHWKASAKTGELKVKEFSKSYFKSQIVDFDALEIPNLEKKISCLTYIVLSLHKKNIPFKFKLKSKVFDGFKEKEKILRELALYGKENKN